VANGTVTLPLGIGSNYTPVDLAVAGAGGFSSASVSGKAINGGHPKKHPRSTDFINEYWTVGSTGITGGTLTGTGTYNDPTDVTGTEASLRAMTWNGTSWSLTGGGQNNASNTVTATIPAHRVICMP